MRVDAAPIIVVVGVALEQPLAQALAPPPEPLRQPREERVAAAPALVLRDDEAHRRDLAGEERLEVGLERRLVAQRRRQML